MAVTTKTPVFISFDYDNDRDLKTLLVGQAQLPDSPFFIEDHSIKIETKGWKADARKRIKRAQLVIVICGLQTHKAVGVAEEVKIARDENVRYFLLRGRKEGTIRRPQGTSWFGDDLHTWTWDNLRSMTAPKSQSWWKKLW